MGKYSDDVYEWEEFGDDWDIDEWNKEGDKIDQLETKKDVIDYYLNRGWGNDVNLMKALLYFIATLDQAYNKKQRIFRI